MKVYKQLYKIRFEWAEIIYDMSKATHLYISVRKSFTVKNNLDGKVISNSLYPFYLIRKPAL